MVVVVVVVLKNWQRAHATRIGLVVHLSDNVSQVPGVVRRRLKDTPYNPSLFFLTAARVCPRCGPARRDDVAVLL